LGEFSERARALIEQSFKKPIKELKKKAPEEILELIKTYGKGKNLLFPSEKVDYSLNNLSTRKELEKRGIDVVSWKMPELIGGSGGPRCMTMPLSRLKDWARKIPNCHNRFRVNYLWVMLWFSCKK